MPAWNTSSFKTDVPLNFTAVVQAGTATSFQLTLDGEPVPGEGPSITATFKRAGDYNITMTSSGKYGTSPSATMTIQVIRPLTQDAVGLLVPSLVVWPPGFTEVVVKITDLDELPTLVQGDLAWGDDLQTTWLDLRSYTPPQASGVVAQNVSHTYTQHGIFLLTLSLHNPVSRVNLTQQVRVVESLTLDNILVEYLYEEDAPPWPSTMYKAGVPLNLTAILKTGTATTFTLSVGDQELSQTTPSVPYTFQSGGEYLVNMTASGEAGVSPVITVPVVVVQSLQPGHLNLTLPEYVVVPPGNATIQMTLTAEELPSYVMYNVSWGDGTTSSLDNLAQETLPGTSGSVVRHLNHTYDVSGDFFLTWTAKNPVSEATVTKTVRVIDKPALGTILIDYLEESDRPFWHSSTFKTGVPLNITAVVLTGEVTSYTFYIGSQEITSASHHISHTFLEAGESTVNMTTSGEAGVSALVSTTISLEHPVLPQHLNLSLNHGIVWPPGEANVTLIVTPKEHMPSNLTGVLSWGDGEDTILDLTNETAPGATGPVVVNLFHNYGEAGDYRSYLSLVNSVSIANLSITLLVMDHLTLEGLVVQHEGGGEGEGGVFRARTPLTFTAHIRTGLAEKFILTLNDEVLSSGTPSFLYTFPRAGEYQATMKAMGEAGTSNSITAIVKVLQPLQEGTARLEVPDKVLSPPGEANITAILDSEEQELPTTVSGWVTWGDDSEPEEVGFLEVTPPGAQGPVSHTLTHTYQRPGDYWVNWYIQNPVSQLNQTQMIPVVQQLRLLGVLVTLAEGNQSLERPEGFFFVGDTISVSPESVLGQASTFTMSLTGQEDLVQNSSNFAVNFDKESDYEFSLVGEGLGGTSNTVWDWVRVRAQLSPPILNVSDAVTRVKQQVVFTIQTFPTLGSCLSLNLEDGVILGWKTAGKCEGEESGGEDWKAVPLSNTLTFPHQYSQPGTYTPLVRFFSAMGEVEVRTTVEVFGALPCDSISVWVQKNGSLEAPVMITRADKLWVRSFAEVNCTTVNLDMNIEWRVVRVNDSEEEDLPGVDFSKSVLYLPGRTLPYGLYRASVSYNFSMINAEGRAVWTMLFGESVVEVGKSQLMVVMVKGGAPRIRRGTLHTLILNPGEISYDPDYPEKPLTNFIWSCHALGEKLPARSVTSDPPENREAYEGKEDHGGCWGEGPGWMRNTAPNITIHVSTFRSPQRTYSIQIIAGSSDGRQNSATVEVEVVEGEPPNLVSICNPSWFCQQVKGAQLVNPAKLILQSGCEVKPGEERVGEDGCGETPLIYSWQVSGISATPGEQPVPLDISDVAVGVYQQKLALLDKFWEKFGTTFRMFDIQVTAWHPGETSQGLALQRIQINEAPQGGVCSAKIDNDDEEEEDGEGGELMMEIRNQAAPTLVVTALTDTIFCNCTGWKDPEGFEIAKYSFFALDDRGTKMIFAFGSRSTGKVVLPFANLSLWTGISDQMGAESLFHMADIVPRLPTKTSFEQYIARSELSKALSVVDQTRVDMLLRAENSLKGISLPVEDYEEVDTEESGKDDSQATEKNKNMLGSVDKFSTTSMDEVIQVNNILGSIADPLPVEVQGSAVEVLVTLSMQADKEAPLSLQQDFVAGALATTASLMKGVNKDALNKTCVASQSEKEMRALRRVRRMAVNETLTDEETEDTSSIYQPSADDVEANEKVKKMLGVVGSSQGALIQAAVVGEEPARIDAGEEVNMAVAFFDAAELKGREVEVGGAVYVFPSYCAILGQPDHCLTNKTVTVGVQMTKWKGTVHGYGGGRDQLSEDSATVQLTLVDAESNPIPVNNSLEDFIMYIPRAQDTIAQPSLIEPKVTSTMPLSLHNVPVPAPRVGVTVLVRPENETDEEDWVLAWSSDSLNTSLEYAENLVFLNDLTYHSDTGFYELFLDSDTIGEVTGIYSVGVGRYNRTLAVPEEHPCFEDPPNNTYLLSYHSNFTASYSFSTFVSSCLFFDDEQLTWSSDGCTVKAANSSVTVCACNHLTSFGSGFFVTPNTIDFSYVFANAGFIDNLTIYLTLIISLGLYFAGLVYARIMDKRDVEKTGATPLSDNSPNDHYLYVIIIHTGQQPNSGTHSKVQFIIVGDWDETDVRTLNDEKRPLLRRGAADHFVMATERSLGPLQYLRIWHDNSGKGKAASWFFSYMVVRDVQTGEEFQFINNEWLAVEEGDGQIDRLVAVAGEEQMKDFSHVFGKTVEKNLADDHLWFSIFLRPPRSRFTRVQRLSACMALLYLSMLVNAMFYEKIPEEPGSGGLRLGPVSVSPQAVVIGFISNLIVFPPSFCIMFFFRKSRPRRPRESRLKAALRRQNVTWAGETDSKGAKRLLSTAGPTASYTTVTSLKTDSEEKLGKKDREKQINPIYLMAMVLATILKRPLDEFEDYDDDEEEFDLGSDEELLHAPPSAQGSRRRSQIQVGAGLSEQELAEAKDKRKRELAMQSLLVEVLVYMIFLLIILSVSHGDRDPNIFFMRENIKSTFALTSQSNCPAFVDAQDTSHFWCWARETLIPSLLSTTLYNGDRRPHNMCGTLMDRVSFLLGYPVLRQTRIRPGDPLQHPATHSNSEDKRDFGSHWNESAPTESIFRYRSALQTHSFPYDGTLDTYGGGGYVVELRGTEAKVMRTLASLQDLGWLDELTKALFMEFAFFNPQVNLFAVTMFVFEFIPGGGIITKFEFQALKLLRYHTPGGAFVLAVEIAYIFFTLFYTRREYKSLKKLGWDYFKSVWSILEIWVLALSYTAIVFYLLKTSLTYYLLDKFIASKGKKYIKIQPLAFLDGILGYVIAFQVFIGTIKLLKLLKFNKRIGMLSATLRYASGDIIGFGLIFTVTLISFVSVFYLNTIYYVREFSTFIKAAESSFFLINKKFEEIKSASPLLGPAFYFVFAFILYWIVFQLLIAIICHAFAKVSQDITRQPNDYEVVEYMMNKLSAYLSALRPNTVQQVNIAPPKPPDIDSQLRYLSASLDKAMGVLDCKVPDQPEKKKVRKRHVIRRK